MTSGIQVKCPKCQGPGIVTADQDNAYFRCLSCGHQETCDRTIYRYDVHNQCKHCGRYYRVDIEDEAKQHFSTFHVAFSIPRRTQADHLPTFMKTAKNRERIVKLLQKLQEK